MHFYVKESLLEVYLGVPEVLWPNLVLHHLVNRFEGELRGVHYFGNVQYFTLEPGLLTKKKVPQKRCAFL